MIQLLFDNFNRSKTPKMTPRKLLLRPKRGAITQERRPKSGKRSTQERLKSNPRAPKSDSRVLSEHSKSVPTAPKRLLDHLKSGQRGFGHVLVMIVDMRFMLLFDAMSGNMLRMMCRNSKDDA